MSKKVKAYPRKPRTFWTLNPSAKAQAALAKQRTKHPGSTRAHWINHAVEVCFT